MNTTHTPYRGFTLLELLVVIAIIGILSAVVLVPLSSTRTRARDRSAEASMQQVLIEAAVYQAKTGNFLGFCTDTTLTNIDAILTRIDTDTGNAHTCAESESAYGIIVQLRGGAYYCVDSTRFFGTPTGTILTPGHLCP